MIQTAGGSKVVLKDFLGESSGFGRQLSPSGRGSGAGRLWSCDNNEMVLSGT